MGVDTTGCVSDDVDGTEGSSAVMRGALGVVAISGDTLGASVSTCR